MVALPLLVASGPAQTLEQPLDRALADALAEQRAAEARTQVLESQVSRARTAAERLHAQRDAAAQAIEAAEARITASDAQFRLAAAAVGQQRQLLARAQLPVSSLLAGLALMAQRPPIAAMADGGGTDELVRIRILLDSTMPVILARTRGLSAQLARGQQLEKVAASARAELVRSRQLLQARRTEFANLEQRALEQAVQSGSQALNSGDAALAAGETIEQLRGEQASRASEQALAAFLATQAPPPPRPVRAAGSAPPLGITYMLPVGAPVTDGLGAVSDSGVRSRGITFSSARGTPVVAPADGVVRFAGPFRDYDGIIIIDHGGGWVSLLVNLSSQLKPGDKVAIGEPVGRALGPLQVQLARGQERFSPAIIAGSSGPLSKGGKSG